MNKFVSILLGLVLIAGAVLVWHFSSDWGSFWNFGTAAWEFLKGGAMWLVILIGVALTIIGVSELKE